MTAAANLRSIFDLSFNEEVLKLKEVNPVLKETEPSTDLTGAEVQGPDDDRKREVSDRMVCSACKCSFVNREEQREHYKLDWHRFNLRQKIAGSPPVTVEEFETKTKAGDLSSISGSESDSDEDEGDGTGGGGNIIGTEDECSAESILMNGRLSCKVLFQNDAGEYLSVYRCVLMGKSDSDEQDAVSSLKAINLKTVWVILMTGGGHFAGAVFEGRQVLQHKTFHRYTVRAKRGTAQGLRDSQNRSHMAKSAGAALRRYNEAALVKDIQDLLLTWAEHLNRASAVFIRAPSYNKTIFFGGRGGPLQKKDPRIRSLPFATRRATFREVQRVHGVLSTVQVYGKDADMSAVFSPSKKEKNTTKAAAQKTAAEEKDKLPAPGEENDESSEEEGEETQLEMVEVTIGTLDLRESEIYPSRRRKRRRKKKEQIKLHDQETGRMDAGAGEEEEGEHGTTPAGEEEVPEQECPVTTSKKKLENKDDVDESVDYGLRDALFTACKVGDVGTVCSLLQLPQEMVNHPEKMENFPRAPLSLLNKPIDSSGFTLLHVAAAAAQKAVVRLLLDAGADPACRDNKSRTPYIVAPDKDTRNIFRKYMGENPDRHDYSKAQIPGPLTAETESKKMEKKKAQRAQRKQREKEQKEEKRKQELEAEEKKRFASLTDREKRALAAEKRLAEQAAASGVSLSNVQRCWSCGESLLGKIPFTYLDYSFCTPRCVQAHRKANAPPSKS